MNNTSTLTSTDTSFTLDAMGEHLAHAVRTNGLRLLSCQGRFDDADIIWDPRADMDDDGDVDSNDQTLYDAKLADWGGAIPSVDPRQAFSDVNNPFMPALYVAQRCQGFQGVPHFALDTEANATAGKLMLNHHRARFADPVTGRWTTRDPLVYHRHTVDPVGISHVKHDIISPNHGPRADKARRNATVLIVPDMGRRTRPPQHPILPFPSEPGRVRPGRPVHPGQRPQPRSRSRGGGRTTRDRLPAILLRRIVDGSVLWRCPCFEQSRIPAGARDGAPCGLGERTTK